MNKKYIILSLMTVIVFTIAVLLYRNSGIIGTATHNSGSISDIVTEQDQVDNTVSSGETAPKRKQDDISLLHDKSPDFAEAIELSGNKDFTGAIELLEKSKTQADTGKEKAIIDFNISANSFALDRLSGARSYIELAKNTTYPPRTRALALQRVYLMYRKYSDEEILQAIAKEMSIKWTSTPEVSLAYAQKAYEIYPLPGFGLRILSSEIKDITNSGAILAVFDKYKKDIDSGILFMQGNPGEITEATSAMLSRANLMGDLHITHGLFTKIEIEELYKSLVQFDQEKQVTVNKQYALLYYANFLAGLNDTQSAQKILQIVITDGLEGALIEALPRYNEKEFSALKSMTGITETTIAELIDFIGSKN